MARLGLATLVSAAALALGASAAPAATVQVVPIYEKANFLGDRVVLRAASGERNEVTLAQETPGTITVADRVPLDPGSACQAISELLIRCTVAAVQPFRLDARVGDGDDSLDAAALDANSAALAGGSGDDHLTGPLDSFGTSFSGGPGNDLLEGGHGADIFVEGAGRNGRDTFVGGSQPDPNAVPSEDQVDYRLRRRPLRVTLDGARNDGEAGEHDRIGRDVERVVGGKAADRMTGNGLANAFDGGPGTDVLRGGPGGDHLIGDELIRPTKRESDVITGGSGDDRLEGGRGDDRMSGGSGHDSFVAGPGDDRIDARDGILDAVLCKSGRDRIRHDGADWIASDCGRRRGPIPAHAVPLVWTDGGDRLFLGVGCPFRKGRNCEAYATVELAGQSFRSRPFTLFPGWHGFLMVPLGARTAEHPDPPLDGAVLALTSTGAGGQVTTESWPLSAVHRDPDEVPVFVPLVNPPFLTPFP